MTHEEFNKLQLEIFDDILKVAKTKGIEYASSKTDRLANFKRLAAELEIPATKVGYIFFKKHLDSITTYLKDGRVYSEEGIRGRFIDAINYLTLIYGLIVDPLSDDRREDGKNIHGVYNNLLGTQICKSCKQYIKPGEEYNYDASGYNHYQLCPTKTQEGEELKPELILEKGIFTGKDVYTGKSIGPYPCCIYCREFITFNCSYIKTSNYYAHEECYEKDLARIEKRKQALTEKSPSIEIRSEEVPFKVYDFLTDVNSKPLSETFRTYETSETSSVPKAIRIRLECAFCFKKFKEAETAFYTPKGHLVHAECLIKYNNLKYADNLKQAKANETSAKKETKTENK